MVIVRYFSAPTDLKGFIVADCEGNENLYINENLSDKEQRETFNHEMRHREYGHLYDDTLTLEEKEQEAEYGKGEETQIGQLEYKDIYWA